MKKLNFGCGRKIMKGWINVDIQKSAQVDKSFNFNKPPYPLNSNTFEYILAFNVLEHLDNPIEALDELHRISIKGAVIEIVVPYYHCKGAYNDPTHKHYFNDTTFETIVNPEKYHKLNHKRKFEIKKLDLIPTRLGKLIYPKKLRWLASLVFGEIISEIRVELKVIK